MTNSPVLGVWADSPDAQRQLQSDIAITRRLQQINYDLSHPIGRALADHLRQFGVGTLIDLHQRDELFSKCATLGIRSLPPRPPTWPANAHQIIVDSVHIAVPPFITKSMPKWEPQSLITTYFVNYSLFEFKKIYSTFCKTSSTEILSGNVIDICSLRSARDDPERQAINRQTVREIASLMTSPELATIVVMSADGKSHNDIAAVLGISPATVGRRLSAFRRLLEHNGWPIDGGK